MKRIVFGLLFLIGFPVCQALADSTAQEIVEVSTGEQPPHTAKKAAHYGYMNHVVKVAFAQERIAVNFVFLPWSRAHKETASGKFVASSYWFNDPRHHEVFYPSNPIKQERGVFFRKKSSLKYETFEEVKQLGLRVGMTRGYTYTDDIWRYARENERLVSVVNTELQNFKMLLLGRIDTFPAEEISGWYMLNKHFSPEQVRTIETLDNELFTRDATLMFSKAHPDAQRLLESFNRGLQKAREAGILDSLEEDFITGKYASSESEPLQNGSAEGDNNRP